MKIKTLLFCGFIAMVMATNAKTFYVATNGSDTSDGLSMDTPFATIPEAVGKATAGDTIFVRGGHYELSEKIDLPTSGRPGQYINLWAYPGEHPFLDFTNQPESSSNRGIKLSGKYWHIKGFEIAYAKDNGLIISGGDYNIVEQCVFHNNKDTGLQISNGSSYNDIINCDSYFNADATYENADGFAAKLDIGPGIRFIGCRSWNNSDDGWDLYEGQYPVVIDHCWSFYNGYLEDSTVGIGSGDMNGFKVGGNYVPADHVVSYCMAFRNGAKGFDQNHNTGNVTLINNMAWQNGKVKNKPNYSFSGGDNIFKNNISFESTTSDIHNGTDQENNSWQGFDVSADDFMSFDTSEVTLPRKDDGSLPDIQFLHLAPDSDMIEAGVDAGIAFAGKAPNLGPFDYDDAGNNAEYNLLYCLNSYMGHIKPGTGLYLKDSEVQLVAVPEPGYLFTQWSGDMQGSDDSVSFTLSQVSSTTVWADFMADTTSSAVNETAANSLVVYPNPASDNLSFYCNTSYNSALYINVFDQMGRLVLAKKVNSTGYNSQINLSVANLPNGQYFMAVQNGKALYKSKFQVVR